MGWLVDLLANACQGQNDNVGAVGVTHIVLEHEGGTFTLLLAANALEFHTIYVPNPQFAAIFLDTQSCCTPSLQLC